MRVSTTVIVELMKRSDEVQSSRNASHQEPVTR